MKAWHWVTLGVASVIGALIVWLLLAYGALPRLWSEHEHKLIGERDQIISNTSQDIPADPHQPANKMVRESRSPVPSAAPAGTQANPLSVRSSVGIVSSVVLRRSYPAAPVARCISRTGCRTSRSRSMTADRAPAPSRLRLWRVGPHDWIGAATFDRGVGLDLYTFQVTHHIGPDVDGERERVSAHCWSEAADATSAASRRG